MAITPLVIELANRFREQLLAQEAQAAGAMIRYYGTVWGQLQDDIDALAAQIQRLQDAGQEFSADKIYRLERMQNVQRQVAEELDMFTRFTGGQITVAQHAAITAGERNAYELTLASFPRNSVTVKFWHMPTDAVETIAGFVADGTPLAKLIEKYVGESSRKFLDALVSGLATGKNPRVIAGQLRQEFGMGLTKALEIARTEQLRAYRTATLASYNASGMVRGWKRLAAKDDRTCMACIVLDGKEYDLATEMDDHPNGRCALIPITPTYAELGIDTQEPQFQQETAREWFERQDEGTQRAMMGNSAFDAWLDKLFDLSDIPQMTTNDVWGNSWTPKPLYALLGQDGPIGTYTNWKAQQ